MLELSVSQLWCTGPEWLSLYPPLPADVELLSMPEPCSRELKSICTQSHNLLTIEQNITIGDLMSCEDFSDLQRLLESLRMS